MRIIKKSLASIVCFSFAALIIGCGGKNSNASEANGAAPLQVAQTQSNQIIEDQTSGANLKMANNETSNDGEISELALNKVKHACEYLDAKEFVYAIASSPKLAKKYIASKIDIAEFTLGSNNEPKTHKMDGENFVYPISQYDYFWIKTGSEKNNNPIYLYTEVNHSSTNAIRVELQELDYVPSDDDIGKPPPKEIDSSRSYSSMLFMPKGKCWELVEFDTYK